MEDVLGRGTDLERFQAFLANWKRILDRRVDEAVKLFTEIRGVHGLVLAGSTGRGEPWPLSDIDLLPIYEDGQEGAQAEIARRRTEMLDRWVDEGWWTGLDIGTLVFTRGEVIRILGPDGPGLMEVLRDDRWYHSVDKGYGGRAVHDPDGLAAALAEWLTEQRFSESVMRLRLERERREVDEALRRFRVCLEAQDRLEATKAVRQVAKWLQIRLLESWGERDNSLGRVGTRFERTAMSRGQHELVNALNALSDLDDESVGRRMEVAPWWVRERHDRSWRARQHIGEEVTRLQDARDVLRVCSHSRCAGSRRHRSRRGWQFRSTLNCSMRKRGSCLRSSSYR